MIEITRDQACDRMLQFAHDGRLVQSSWHTEQNGRHLACLLGSIDTTINSPSDCPASAMPAWLAECLPTLFDGVSENRAVPLGIQFAEALRIGNTDETVMHRWLVRVVEQAVESATPTDTSPNWWQKVDAACKQVVAALKSGDRPAARAGWAEAAAAEAARAAGWAAAEARQNAYDCLFVALIEEMRRDVVEVA